VSDRLDTQDSAHTGLDRPGAESPDGLEGLVFDIKRYAIHDGPGIRTTVFLKGCNLTCRWCHNPESWRSEPEPAVRPARCSRCGRCAEVCPNGAVTVTAQGPVTDTAKCTLCGLCVEQCPGAAREIIGKRMTVTETMAQIERDIIFYDQSGGGVTFSGGEPLLQLPFLLALLERCRQADIHTAVDTSCYAPPEAIETVGGLADLFLCDIKHTDSEAHREFTGVENTVILNNIRRLAEAGKAVVIRLPVIPGFNDDRANIEATAEFAAALANLVRIDLLPYNRAGAEKAVRLSAGPEPVRIETPGDDLIHRVAEQLANHGLDVRIGG